VERYEIIDKVGLFLPILVNELNLLGEKVFYKPRKEKIIIEVAAFISFLQRYAEKEEGEETVPENFEGAYCRCVIIIIARQLKRKISDLGPFINYIKKTSKSSKIPEQRPDFFPELRNEKIKVYLLPS